MNIAVMNNKNENKFRYRLRMLLPKFGENVGFINRPNTGHSGMLEKNHAE